MIMRLEEIKKILPHRYPFLLVDRVLEIKKGTYCKALKNISANEEVFQGHFPKQAVLPGVMIIEALAQTAGIVIQSAKEEKQQELITRQQLLREKVRAFEQEMRVEERRLSEAIFKELKTVIRSISINEKLDLVLEKNAAQVILYMKEDTTDLTQKVIDEYNALKKSGNE